jgi:hypothetical protein
MNRPIARMNEDKEVLQARGPAPASLFRCSANRETAPTPILHLDLLNHDEGRFERLVKDIEKQLASSLD